MVLTPDVPLQNLNDRDRPAIAAHIAGLSPYQGTGNNLFHNGEWVEAIYIHGEGMVPVPLTQVERDLKAGGEKYRRISQDYYYVWGGSNALDGRIVHRDTGEVLYTDEELVAKRPYAPEYTPLVKRAASGMGIPAFELDRVKEIAQYYKSMVQTLKSSETDAGKTDLSATTSSWSMARSLPIIGIIGILGAIVVGAAAITRKLRRN